MADPSNEMSVDQAGAIPMRERACVLLSGGMDSVTCLHWAISHYREVRALGFDYGQPHRDAELTAAGKIARRNGVLFETIAVADALHSGLLTRVPAHAEEGGPALHRAFVPGRNLVFLSLALSRVCQWWPIAIAKPDLEIVIGSCLEDAGGFPDCREQFIDAASRALALAVDRDVRIAAPYVRMAKADILRDASKRFPSALVDIQESWSCYAGKGPCGTCTACVMRVRAFADYGLEDKCAAPVMFGGDTSRNPSR